MYNQTCLICQGRKKITQDKWSLYILQDLVDMHCTIDSLLDILLLNFIQWLRQVWLYYFYTATTLIVCPSIHTTSTDFSASTIQMVLYLTYDFNMKICTASSFQSIVIIFTKWLKDFWTDYGMKCHFQALLISITKCFWKSVAIVTWKVDERILYLGDKEKVMSSSVRMFIVILISLLCTQL